jgi:hypothetical protein
MADDPEVEDLSTETPGDDDEIEAPAEGDAPEAEEDTDPDAEPASDEDADPEPRRPSRSENVRRRAQEAELRAARLEGELEAMRRTGTHQPDRAAQEQAERDRLALMTPDERAAYLIDRNERQTTDRIAQAERRVAARMDRSEFRALMAEKPNLSRYEAEVERRFEETFKGGGFVERSTILRWAIGDAMMKQAPKAADKQRRQADARRQRETTRAGAGRSDVPAQRGKKGKSAADRLTDVTF